MENKFIIRCPHCGAEYLPQEIFIPEDFLPPFDDLVKDESGKIVALYEKPMNTHEEYTCDYCNHRFKVEAKVEFITSEIPQHDFEYDYESPLYSGDRIELAEND